MKGFKCDKCGNWSEGIPASQGYHRYVQNQHRPLTSITVVLRATEEGSSNALDLCEGCLIEDIKLFVESHETDYPIGKETR